MNMAHKLAVAVTAAALTAAGAVGTAQAAPATHAAPSACRPANHTAKITIDHPSAGHLHYRVTLTAPRGYASCTLVGSPTNVHFSHHGKRLPYTAGKYGTQTTRVKFGPGHPVHFDIQVRNNGRGVAADEASFTLKAPGGVIPGTQFAKGSFKVTTGTLIGPVLAGK